MIYYIHKVDDKMVCSWHSLFLKQKIYIWTSTVYLMIFENKFLLPGVVAALVTGIIVVSGGNVVDTKDNKKL